MTSYTTLVADKSTEGSIRNWISRTDTPATAILTEAQSWIYQRLRVREMVAREVMTIPINLNVVNLPDRYLDPINYLPYGYQTPLDYVHEDDVRPSTETDGTLFPGTPTYWTVIGEQAVVDAKMVADFPGTLMFYKQPADLSDSNETNFLTRRYPSLLRYACLAYAFEHNHNWNRRTEYLGLAIGAVEDANATNELNRRGQMMLDD